jgi:hypothetical protein
MEDIISKIESSMPSKKLAEKRLEICKSCGLFKKDIFSFKMKCSSSLYLNPKTNETSKVQKAGFVRGCGCYLDYKVNNINAKCPAGKW